MNNSISSCQLLFWCDQSAFDDVTLTISSFSTLYIDSWTKSLIFLHYLLTLYYIWHYKWQHTDCSMWSSSFCITIVSACMLLYYISSGCALKWCKPRQGESVCVRSKFCFVSFNDTLFQLGHLMSWMTVFCIFKSPNHTSSKVGVCLSVCLLATKRWADWAEILWRGPWW